MTTDKSSHSKQMEQISDVSLIEEGGYSKLMRSSISFIAIILALFILWASLTQIDEVAVSFGEIQPKQDIQSIQHLQGGTVATIYVKNGQEVEEGEQLLKFDPESAKSELQKSQSKELSLMLDVERLQAFIHKTPMSDINWRKSIEKSPYNTLENQKNIENSIRENNNLLTQQNRERQNQYAIYTEKIAQKKSQLLQYDSSKSELEKGLALYQKEEAMYESLVKTGYVSKIDHINAQRKTIESTAQLKQIYAKIESSRSEMNEAEEELKKLDTTFNKQALEELNTINSQLLEIHHTIQRLTELNKNLVITAPIRGIIKGLTVLPGSVIAPGSNIFDIVPTGGDMDVQCKVSTRDIGHIKIGDPAQIKVMAYEFTRYGTVNGKVVEISASTFTDQDKLPYYKTKIALSKNYVGDNPKFNQLKPGMTVQVDIMTGKKSLISYLLKPITRGLSEAFKER